MSPHCSRQRRKCRQIVWSSESVSQHRLLSTRCARSKDLVDTLEIWIVAAQPRAILDKGCALINRKAKRCPCSLPGKVLEGDLFCECMRRKTAVIKNDQLDSKFIERRTDAIHRACLPLSGLADFSSSCHTAVLFSAGNNCLQC